MTIAGGEWAQAVVTRAREHFAVRRAALFWRDAAGTLSCIASAGPGGGADWVGQVLPAGVGAAGRAVAEGRPFWSADLLADPRIPMAEWLRERLEREGLRSVVAAPLKKGGAVLGALGLLDEARAYGEADLAGLAAFADEAALAAPADTSG